MMLLWLDLRLMWSPNNEVASCRCPRMGEPQSSNFSNRFPKFLPRNLAKKYHHVPRKVPKFPPTFPRNFSEYAKVHPFSPSISEVSSPFPRNLPVFPIVSEVLVPSPTSPTPRPTPAPPRPRAAAAWLGPRSCAAASKCMRDWSPCCDTWEVRGTWRDPRDPRDPRDGEGSTMTTIKVGGLEHGFYFSIIYGMSSFPLTNSYFFRGVKTTN